MANAIGVREWVIAEGYIPRESHGPKPQMTSHETVCLLNASELLADKTIRMLTWRFTVYYRDREPVGPYRLTVPARRTMQGRFNDFSDPEFARIAWSRVFIVRSVPSSTHRRIAAALASRVGISGA